ncbi:NAD(+) diphosphatase [Pontibacter harenae]|uniref:NAD(+) diphosphatase n=1 Tax=Pontibacter harenae TaxID=2894083 RepID=UPI001E52F309|nr:NAD(+) diphosphatase [Pontibacter harenae]MCC9166307.1 NAD(+) diphosphatase [Pontibacter harenae]
MNNYFADSTLDRFAEHRKNVDLMLELRERETSRFVIVNDNKVLVNQNKAALLTQDDVKELAEQATVQVLLGVEEETAYFALGFEGQQALLEERLPKYGTLVELRTIAAALPRPQSTMLGYARAMVHWNHRHGFCANCGTPTLSEQAGHVRICPNSTCNLHHFPRTDTAIIVIISEGDACLLGRHASWPQGQHATIAGFLEPGETLEGAVEREAKEETGVELESVTYHSSQPWPFPASIMVGFTATAKTRELKVDYTELEDARWFTRDEIVAGLQAGTLRLPPPVSISFRLIHDWFNQATGYTLQDFL